MSEQPKRAVAYIRESTEEQGRGYSPDGQRQAIARYATEHGMQLTEEYLDFETGRLADKRAGFQRLIEDAMERRFEVVLVFHTSRFARNTVEAKRYKKLLRSQLGIEVISVTQPLGADANDPAAFLSESVHEIFDEYYSVSLSFWTKMGLREKARQGKLTGSLPWGYVKGEDEIAAPDAEKAPWVRRLFEMYATGLHTDRTLAAWLNVNEQRTARGRTFSPDTVREMLCNAAYCGYVSPRRDRTKTIKGLHEPIVEEALFDRVQEMRRQRARNLKPGRPSQRYLLRGLARCERCQGKMQGTAIGRKLVARYYCATRRADHSCDQPLVHAERVEAQLVQFVADFKPNPAVREEILRRLAGTATTDTTEAAQRRAQLEQRLRRARDLYELGDLTRPEYMARREAINTELATSAPGPIPDLDQAQQVLEDFSIFWQNETDPAAKRQLLTLIFERIWLDGQHVAAVQPKPSFAPFFENQPPETAGKGMCKERERRDSNPRPHDDLDHRIEVWRGPPLSI
ncbi:MAG TPA: recombinase family protein [Solirubrobacteraceae bacterium]|nr:recombinase family protein [Solirubrobacteraceae bacterium]